MSPEAHDLIQRLLDKDPKTRLGAHGAEEIKNHKFFTSKGFNWGEAKNWKPPMIPDAQLDEMKNEKTCEKDQDKITKYLNEPECQNLKKVGKSRTVKNIDLGDFQMRRVDVLDDMNQKAYMKIQKQKSMFVESSVY